MAATNINRVVITGNLTRDPELRSLPSGMSVCTLRIASNTRRKDKRRVGRQAQLLQRHRLGRAGRELRPLPVQGPPGRHRRPPGVARVAGPGRQQARVGRDRRRRRPVPRRARGGRSSSYSGGSNGGFAPHSDVPADTSDFAPQPVGARAARRPTTTSRFRSRRDIPAGIHHPDVPTSQRNREGRRKLRRPGGACDRGAT